MAVEMNDSYHRCIAELRARYQGRGVATNMQRTLTQRAVREESVKEDTQRSYVLFDSRSGIGDLYRSGEYKGSKYMTSSDFVRYFKSRRAFYCPGTQQATEVEAVPNSAVPQRKGNGAGNRSLTPSESGSKEGHIRGVWSTALELVKKWFPVERSEGRIRLPGARIPATILSGIAVFTLSLGLIVGGSVLVGNASGEVGTLNSRISVLEAEEADLQGKLDLKYNVSDIEADAKELGMIKRQYAENQYTTLESEEEVVIYGEEEKSFGLASLLSSFGIELD